MNPRERARQAISLLDLTSLNASDDEARIVALCRRAQTPVGNVAALCVWPRLIAVARRALGDCGIKVAAVANFPAGAADPHQAAQEAREIVEAGGDEVDVVFPYNSWLNGDRETGPKLVAQCKSICRGKTLKVILETGCLWRDDTIAEVAEAAIAAGADFVKTSTGKTAISATPRAARAMLAVIKNSGGRCGLKVSGGIRDAAAAAHYLDISAQVMGEPWISAATFRFGASGVLDNLLAVASGEAALQSLENY